MIVSINQPAYLPWLGYFERIAKSDIHVVLDHVQFEKNSFTNRNKIRLKSETAWLTIPVASKGRFGSLEINRLELANEKTWQTKHWNSLQTNYARAPFFSTYSPPYELLYKSPALSFFHFIKAFLLQHLHDLGIKTPILFSSDLKISGQKSDLVLNICQALGAKTYLSGALGRNYLDYNSFEEAGISIRYQDYHHPTYRQAWPGFESHLGILDLLFNHGPESLTVLLSNQHETSNETISDCGPPR
jgi:hypothetical protein